MGQKVQITEYLDIDLETEKWCCNRCGRELISARENYKKGCLVYDRDPGPSTTPCWKMAVSPLTRRYAGLLSSTAPDVP